MNYFLIMFLTVSTSGFCLDCIGGDGYESESALIQMLDNHQKIYASNGLNAKQRKDMADKAKNYKKLADAKFREAEQICLVFPYDDKQAAIKFFKDAVFLSISDRNFAGVVRTLIVCLSDYGISVYSEWSRMQSLLREAESYYELYQDFDRVANGGQFKYMGLIGDTLEEVDYGDNTSNHIRIEYWNNL